MQVSFQSDETIYTQGQAAQTLYIMTRGSVELTKQMGEDHAKPVQREIVSAAGAALGELAFFFNIRHINTARTMSNAFVIVLTLHRDQFQQLIRNFQVRRLVQDFLWEGRGVIVRSLFLGTS